jgi:hypothetical protein
MKEKDGYVDCPEQQVILYVEKEDGSYGPIQTGSYLTRNFLDDYELKRRHLEESLREKIHNKEISPVQYFMILEDLTLSELSARAGLRKGKVRKHLEYASFQSIRPDILQKYAEVFNVSLEEMEKLMKL